MLKYSLGVYLGNKQGCDRKFSRMDKGYNMSILTRINQNQINKFHAKKVKVGDHTYDSKKESKRAGELEFLERMGQIRNLKKQVPFELQEGYTNNQGKKIRPINYIADFTYEKDGELIVEDCKGFRTKEYLLKKKLFEHKYREYTFVES